MICVFPILTGLYPLPPSWRVQVEKTLWNCDLIPKDVGVYFSIIGRIDTQLPYKCSALELLTLTRKICDLMYL